MDAAGLWHALVLVGRDPGDGCEAPGLFYQRQPTHASISKLCDGRDVRVE